LFRSYRSTWEIAQFSLRIVPNPNLIAMERHGEEPQVKEFATSQDETKAIGEWVMQFGESKNKSLGIICKTQKQAKALFEKIKEHKVHLLTPDSTSFSSGTIITTVHLAKGLEFDEVIVPFVSANNYKSDIDKRMLYIACTRAMHKLTLTYERERSDFLK
jgi:DNA helicase-2/ATP-dependent DNA helicase PcrA